MASQNRVTQAKDIEILLISLKVKADIAKKFAQPLAEQFVRFGLSSLEHQAIFIANAMVESQGFTRMRENLNYTTEDRLLAVFGAKRFEGKQVASYLKNPIKLGNLVYNGRMGNLPNSNDGYMFRGGGIFMITGRHMYMLCDKLIPSSKSIIADPNNILDPEVACIVSVYYFKLNNLDVLFDKEKSNGPRAVCNFINKGHKSKPALELDSRLNYYLRILAFFKKLELDAKGAE